MLETYKELYTMYKEVNFYMLLCKSIQMREQIYWKRRDKLGEPVMLNYGRGLERQRCALPSDKQWS